MCVKNFKIPPKSQFMDSIRTIPFHFVAQLVQVATPVVVAFTTSKNKSSTWTRSFQQITQALKYQTISLLTVGFIIYRLILKYDTNKKIFQILIEVFCVFLQIWSSLASNWGCSTIGARKPSSHKSGKPKERCCWRSC